MNYKKRMAAEQELNRTFTDAIAHHQAGHIPLAEAGYRKVLAGNPLKADALHLLGVTCHQSGRGDEGIALIRKAIGINPRAGVYHSNLGNLLAASGKFEEALDAYDKALALDPGLHDTYSNVGTALRSLGRNEEALSCYQKAVSLAPMNAMARNNMAYQLKMLGRSEEALACWKALAREIPSFAPGLNSLGIALRELGQIDEAIAVLNRAVKMSPDSPEAYNNLGLTLKDARRREESEAAFRKAIALKRDFTEAYDNLGIVLKEMGRLAEALPCHRQAIALQPNFSMAHTNLGIALTQMSRPQDALICFQKALEAAPDNPVAHNASGIAYGMLMRNDEAIESYKKARVVAPTYPEVHVNLATELLRRGDFTEAWPEYEWRWQTGHLSPDARHYPQPQWYGEEAAGKTLLMYCEQGMGDTLQFCRYAKHVAARGLKVIVEVPPPLHRLVATSLEGVSHVVSVGQPMPHFDLHCAMLSVPMALGTNSPADIPGECPYLAPTPADAAMWAQRLSSVRDGRPLVGVVWAGNPRTHNQELAAVDRRRSVSPELLAPLMAVDGVRFVSLQKDVMVPPELSMIDMMAYVRDFADTAALVSNLDLVISVDTSVLHLAAAVGKPVWMMDRFDYCWRWLKDRNDSPWYPKMRIYRQKYAGAWEEVVANVAADLSASVREGRLPA